MSIFRWLFEKNIGAKVDILIFKLKVWLNSFPTWLRGSFTSVLLVALYAGALFQYINAQSFASACDIAYSNDHSYLVVYGLLQGLYIPGLGDAALVPRVLPYGVEPFVVITYVPLLWVLVGALVVGKTRGVKVIVGLLLCGLIGWVWLTRFYTLVIAGVTLLWALVGALVVGKTRGVKVMGWLLLFGLIGLDVLAGATALLMPMAMGC